MFFGNIDLRLSEKDARRRKANLPFRRKKIRIKIFISRTLSGTADAAVWGTVVSILMKLFPKRVSTIAAWTETLFSFGYMLGNFAHKFSLQKKLFQN